MFPFLHPGRQRWIVPQAIAVSNHRYHQFPVLAPAVRSHIPGIRIGHNQNGSLPLLSQMMYTYALRHLLGDRFVSKYLIYQEMPPFRLPIELLSSFGLKFLLPDLLRLSPFSGIVYNSSHV